MPISKSELWSTHKMEYYSASKTSKWPTWEIIWKTRYHIVGCIWSSTKGETTNLWLKWEHWLSVRDGGSGLAEWERIYGTENVRHLN